LISRSTEFDGVVVIEPELFKDNRGWFMESYSLSKMAEIGIDVLFVQDNHSFSSKKGVIRGFHFQDSPMEQAKLVRCSRGSILDFAVDIRTDSPRYAKWFSIMLSSTNMTQLFIPHGYAHGFVTLEDDTEVQYKVDRPYSKQHERTIRYDDPEIAIDWGALEPVVSERDSQALFLSNVENQMRFHRP
jgi:dTDP-4-dehydrorhamnose 3,5-epimerase